MAIVMFCDFPLVRVLAFILAEVQTVQLICYSHNAWMMKDVKLHLFDIISIGLDFFPQKERESEKEKQRKIIEKQNREMKKVVHRDIYVMYLEAEEKCRVIIQNANNEAAAIVYRAQLEAKEIKGKNK